MPLVMENSNSDTQLEQNQNCSTEGVHSAVCGYVNDCVKTEPFCEYDTHKEDNSVAVKTEKVECDMLYCHDTELLTYQENIIMRTENFDKESLTDDILNDDDINDVKLQLKCLVPKTESVEILQLKQEECSDEFVDAIDTSGQEQYRKVEFKCCGLRDTTHGPEILRLLLKKEHVDYSGGNACLPDDASSFQDSLSQTYNQHTVSEAVQRRHSKCDVINRHSKKELFTCKLCDYSGTRKKNLARHIISKHSENKPFSCNLCDYATVLKTALSNHIMSKHNESKPFSCNLCDYTAVKEVSLNTHIMSKHTKEKPFTCSLCDFGAVQKLTLKRHILSKHSEEKPHRCKLCDYGAVQMAHLRTHIISRHNKEKPFSCNLCDYASADKQILKRHINNKHTKEKPYTCNLCDYGATQKAYLKRHLLSRHSV